MKSFNRLGWLATALLTGSSARHTGQVVISEIMCHPPPGRPEYTEVLNLDATLTVLVPLSFVRDDLPDASEVPLALNTNNTTDATLDLDGDGVSTRDE